MLLAGCPLATFRVEDGPAVAGAGGSGTAGAGSGGLGMGALGGGFAGQINASEPRVTDDVYFILQGEELSLGAEQGPLSNDVPEGLFVVSRSDVNAARPSDFDADFELTREGAFRFRPQPEFFGAYPIEYAVQNVNGARAFAKIVVQVVPVDISLDTVVSGLGGYVLYGPPDGKLGAALDRGFDLNADKRQELIVGAPGAAGGDGAVFIVFGSERPTSFDLSLTPSDDEAARYFTLTADVGDELGVAVAGLDDVDADGKPDFAVASAAGSGRVHVVRGSSLSRDVRLPSPTSFSFEGDASNVEVGRLLRRVGDVDGDGIDELFVSASNADFGWGHLLRVGGMQSGSSPITSAPGFHVQAAQAGDGFPLDAASVGDLDRDRKKELLVASKEDFALLRGAVSLPSSIAALGVDGSRGGYRLRRPRTGTASVAGVSDVNADGHVDLAYCEAASVCRVVFGPPVTLATGWEISGFARGTRQVLLAGDGGRLKPGAPDTALAQDGDLDGDKIGDVVLADSSSVYVVRGRRAGFDPVDLQTFSDGYRIRAASDGKVTQLALIGDVNGDERPDLAIADETADEGAGRVYVLFSVPGG